MSGEAKKQDEAPQPSGKTSNVIIEVKTHAGMNENEKQQEKGITMPAIVDRDVNEMKQSMNVAKNVSSNQEGERLNDKVGIKPSNEGLEDGSVSILRHKVSNDATASSASTNVEAKEGAIRTQALDTKIQNETKPTPSRSILSANGTAAASTTKVDSSVSGKANISVMNTSTNITSATHGNKATIATSVPKNVEKEGKIDKQGPSASSVSELGSSRDQNKQTQITPSTISLEGSSAKALATNKQSISSASTSKSASASVPSKSIHTSPKGKSLPPATTTRTTISPMSSAMAESGLQTMLPQELTFSISSQIDHFPRHILTLLQTYGPLTSSEISHNLPPAPPSISIPKILQIMTTLNVIHYHQDHDQDDHQDGYYYFHKGEVRGGGDVVMPHEIMNLIQDTTEEIRESMERIHLLKKELLKDVKISNRGKNVRDFLRDLVEQYSGEGGIRSDAVYATALKSLSVDGALKRKSAAAAAAAASGGEHSKKKRRRAKKKDDKSDTPVSTKVGGNQSVNSNVSPENAQKVDDEKSIKSTPNETRKNNSVTIINGNKEELKEKADEKEFSIPSTEKSVSKNPGRTSSPMEIDLPENPSTRPQTKVISVKNAPQIAKETTSTLASGADINTATTTSTSKTKTSSQPLPLSTASTTNSEIVEKTNKS